MSNEKFQPFQPRPGYPRFRAAMMDVFAAIITAMDAVYLRLKGAKHAG